MNTRGPQQHESAGSYLKRAHALAGFFRGKQQAEVHELLRRLTHLWNKEEKVPAHHRLDALKPGLRLIRSGSVQLPREGWLLPKNVQHLGPGGLHGLELLVQECAREDMSRWLADHHQSLGALLGPKRLEELRGVFAGGQNAPSWARRLPRRVAALLAGQHSRATTLEDTQFFLLPSERFKQLPEELIQHLLQAYQADLLNRHIAVALSNEARLSNVSAPEIFRLIESATLAPREDQRKLGRGETADGIYVLLEKSCTIYLSEGNIATIEAPACLGLKSFLLKQPLSGDLKLQDDASLMARIDGEAFWQLFHKEPGMRRAVHRGNPELLPRFANESPHQVLVVDGHSDAFQQLSLEALVAGLAERLALHLQEHVLLLQVSKQEVEASFEQFPKPHNGWVVRIHRALPPTSTAAQPFLPRPGAFSGRSLMDRLSGKEQLVAGRVNVTLVDVSRIDDPKQRARVLQVLAQQKDPADPLNLLYLATEPSQLPSPESLPKGVRLVPTAVLVAAPPPSMAQALEGVLEAREWWERAVAVGRTSQAAVELLGAMGSHVKRIIQQPRPKHVWPLGTVRFRPVPLAQLQSAAATKAPLDDASFRESMDRLARAATNRRVGLALGGGGGFGYVHVALIRKLREGATASGLAPSQASSQAEPNSSAIPIDLVSGSSFGALVGAFYCTAGEQGLRLITEHWRLLTPLVPMSALSSVWFQWWLEALLGPIELDQLEVPLIPMAVDADTGAEWDVRHGSVAYGVRASGSMPPFIGPTIEGNRRLLDGGIVANVPVDVLRAEGADVLIASNPISRAPLRPRTFPRFPLVETVWRQLNPKLRFDDSIRLVRLLGRAAGEAQLPARDVAVYRPRFNSAWVTSFKEARQTVAGAEASIELTLFVQEVRARWRELLNNPVSLVHVDIAAQKVWLEGPIFFDGDELAHSSSSAVSELEQFIQEHDEIHSCELVVFSVHEALAQRRAEKLKRRLLKRLGKKEPRLTVKGHAQALAHESLGEVWLENVSFLEESSSRERRLMLRRAMDEANARRLEVAADRCAERGEPDQARTIALQASRTENSLAIARLLRRLFALRGSVKCRFKADVAVTALAWSPDQSSVAVGYKDGSLGLLDVESRKARKWPAHLRTDNTLINALAWSPDGQYLASCGTDYKVMLWTRAEQGLVNVAPNQDVETWNHWGLAFEPGGTYLLAPDSQKWSDSRAGSRSAGLFRIEQGRLSQLLENKEDPVGRVVAAAWMPAPGVPRFATLGEDTLILWEATEEGPQRLLTRRFEGMSTLAWMDRETLAVGGEDGAFILRFEELTTSEKVQLREPPVELKTGTLDVHHLAWTPDRMLLAAIQEDNAVFVWNEAGQLLNVMQGQRPGSVQYVAANPHFPELCISWGNEVVNVWDLRISRQVAVLGGHMGKILSATWDASGEQLATASVDGLVQVWSFVTQDPQRMSWKELRVPKLPNRGPDIEYPHDFVWPQGGVLVPISQHERRPVWAKAWAREGERLAAAVNPGPEEPCTVRFWSQNEAHPVDVNYGRSRELSVRWSPEGTRVALQEPRRVSVWDAESEQLVAEVVLKRSRVRRVAWDVTGRWLAIGQMVLDETAVMLWDGRPGTVPVAIAEREKFRDGVLDLSWSPKGDQLAVAYNSGQVHLYAVEDGRRKDVPVRRLLLPQPAKRVAWAPMGELLACADESGGVTIWNVNTQEQFVPEGQYRRDRCHHLVWSQQGQFLFSADKQGHSVIWQARPGGGWESVIVVEKTPSPIHWAAFSTDQKWVIMMEHTGLVRFLPFNVEVMVKSLYAWKGPGAEIPVRDVPVEMIRNTRATNET